MPEKKLSRRDEIAVHALAALITKIPLIDRDETPEVTDDKINDLRASVADSAVRYADDLVARLDDRDGCREPIEIERDALRDLAAAQDGLLACYRSDDHAMASEHMGQIVNARAILERPGEES